MLKVLWTAWQGFSHSVLQRGKGNHTVRHAGLISGEGIFRFVRSGDEINIVSKEQHGKP